MTRSAEYWESRAREREAAYQAGSEDAIRRVKAAYDRAFKNIEKAIADVTRTFERHSGPLALDAQAYYARLSRLASVKRVIAAEMKRLAVEERAIERERYAALLEEGYYRTLFDVSKGSKLAANFALLPKAAVSAALSEGWLGSNFSKRIWKNTSLIGEAAGQIVAGGLLSGESIYTMRDQLMKSMHDQLSELDDKGKRVAERLIRTETNYYSNRGEMEAYREAGIERYQFLATLDNRTSQVCQDHDGRTYALDEARVGENWPPLHPNCRSTTVAVFDDEAVEGLERRARDPETGRLYKLPAEVTYKEWRGDQKLFQDYERLFDPAIDKEFPQTLASFQQVKYNEPSVWEALQEKRAELDRLYQHLTVGEGVARGKHLGVKGGHNRDAFFAAIDADAGKLGLTRAAYKITETPHPTVTGISEMTYEIPKLRYNGTVDTVNGVVQTRRVKDPKTVYDPSVYSDDEIYKRGRRAVDAEFKSGKKGRLTGTDNGLDFTGQVDNNGILESVYPTLR
ncbi:MAG: minor capsid protein [Treponema sp.]|jgi:SPP1 gp7 family putative phage head morphogenesis protein|nr:minor capsid protein [Treponema sp.]